MIYEATSAENHQRSKSLDFCTLLLLFVATSVDALTVGLSFAFLRIPTSCASYNNWSYNFCVVHGQFLGDRFRGFRIGAIGILGGLILMAIGAKIPRTFGIVLEQ